MKREMSSANMPPTAGKVIGFATSLPVPVLSRIGTSAMMVVNVVIRQGRTGRKPASSTRSRMSAMRS